MLRDDAGDRHDSGRPDGFPQRANQRQANDRIVLQTDEDLLRSAAKAVDSVPVAAEVNALRDVVCLARDPRRDQFLRDLVPAIARPISRQSSASRRQSKHRAHQQA